MKFENILITDLIYKDKILYIYLRHYYTKEKYYNKILKLKNVKKFTHFLSEFYITFLPEFIEVEEELKIHFFSRPFYRNKKRK